jgi:hypothetical protein
MTPARHLGPAFLIVAAALAGCQGQGPAPASPGALTWPAMDVHTTAAEAFEETGLVRIAWGDTTFGIQSAKESDLARTTLVTATHAYTSYGQRWTRDTLSAGVERSNRLVLWDLRAVAASPGMHLDESRDQGSGLHAYHWTGTIDGAGTPLAADLRLTTANDAVVSARLASSAGRESPYTFNATTQALSFPLVEPSEWKDRSETSDKDSAAQEGHSTLVLLLQDYQQRHGGTLPQTVTRDSLATELLVRGASWPSNPYTGTGMASGDGPGAFSWTRCALSDGLFVGHRWDGETLSQPFGASCS